MFSAKYNALALLNLSFNVINTALIYYKYGASGESDIYFIGFAMLSGVQLVFQMAIEQFPIIFRNRLRASDRPGQYFSSVSIVLGICGVVLTVGLLLGAPTMVRLFASGLDDVRNAMMVEFARPLFISLVFYLPLQIALGALNALEEIGFAYSVSALPVVFVSVALVFPELWFSLNFVGFAYAAGTIVATVVGVYRLYRNDRVRLTWTVDKLSDIWSLVRISFAMRAAHNIHNLFLSFAIGNLTSSFAAGTASNFFYAKKISDACMTVAFGPTQKILMNRFVDAMHSREREAIHSMLKKVSIVFPAVFIGAFICSAVVLLGSERVFSFQFKFSVFDVIVCLAILLAANALIAVEVSYGILNQIGARYGVVILANVGFVILFCLSYFLLHGKFALFALPIAIFVGQTSNFFVNRFYARKMLSKFELPIAPAGN